MIAYTFVPRPGPLPEGEGEHRRTALRKGQLQGFQVQSFRMQAQTRQEGDCFRPDVDNCDRDNRAPRCFRHATIDSCARNRQMRNGTGRVRVVVSGWRAMTTCRVDRDFVSFCLVSPGRGR